MNAKQLQSIVCAAVVASISLAPHVVAQRSQAANVTALQTEQQVAPPVSADNQPRYRRVNNIVFAPDRKLAGDMYLPDPDDGQPHPAVIVVHGGAWILGSRDTFDQIDIARRLASHGYVAFSIDYRLLNDNGLYPNPIKDVNDAFGYLVTNAKKWGVDETRIGMFGASVGAHMALLSAYAPHTGSFAPLTYKDVTQKVKAVVAHAPLTDMREIELTWVFKFMDDTPWHTPSLYAEASPITYIATAVPTLLLYGTVDSTVDPDQSVRLYKALRANHVTAQLIPLQLANHRPLPNEVRSLREPAFAAIMQFFDKNLKGESAPSTATQSSN